VSTSSRGLFLGLCTLDIEYVVDSFPGPDDKIVARDQIVASGGPATNAAKTFAALGGYATLATALETRDPLGSQLDRLVRESGVDVVDLGGGGGTPALSSIIVSASTGERAVISVNGGPTSLATQAAEEVPLMGQSVLLVDGHHMAVALAVVEKARSLGLEVAFDGGSWKPDTEHLLASVDWAICSDRFRPPGVGPGADSVLSYLTSCGVRGAAVTLGGDGVRIEAEGRRESLPPYVPPGPIVDTLGAGDVFHGVACYHMASGMAFREALHLANESAGRSCSHIGVDRYLSQLDRD
jgi:sugar/nucleoside kinase (ribokinase family)